MRLRSDDRPSFTFREIEQLGYTLFTLWGMFRRRESTKQRFFEVLQRIRELAERLLSISMSIEASVVLRSVLQDAIVHKLNDEQRAMVQILRRGERDGGQSAAFLVVACIPTPLIVRRRTPCF